MSYITPIGPYTPPFLPGVQPATTEKGGGVAAQPQNIFETTGSLANKPKTLFESYPSSAETAGQVASASSRALDVAA